MEGDGLDTSDDLPGWAWPALDDPNRERRMLEQIADAARTASRAETKLACLARLLKRLEARGEQAIVFTEYRDTLMHVLSAVGEPGAVIHGGLSREERRAALAEFQCGRRRVLLATDAAGEGLNLQRNCRVVVNLELPWNPMRLEQRIGRVDRIGQKRAVHVFNLIACETGERSLFERLARRVDAVRRDIGSANPLAAPRRGDFVDRLSAPEGAVADLPAGAIPLVRLSAEAETELGRLAYARAVTRGRSEWPSARTASEGPWLTRARSAAARAALGGRLLALTHVSCEDAVGRVVASHLVGFEVRVRNGVDSRHLLAVSAMLRQLDAAWLQLAADRRSAWLREAAAVGAAFWRRRLARERAIAAGIVAAQDASFQPGLFDRRAGSAREEISQALSDRLAESSRRIALAERLGSVESAIGRPVLVLSSR
jgi:hypothetical protein